MSEKNKSNEPRINEMIRSKTVRLIDDEGNQVGIISVDDALGMARSKNLDLVEVSPTVAPPVCRIMDYGKYKYQAAKKKQEAKKKQTVIQVKEIKLRQKTEEHDILVKLKQIRKFLEDGNRVKVTIRFRGREITHTERGVELLNRLILEVSEYGDVEQQPRMEGRTLVAMFSAKK